MFVLHDVRCPMVQRSTMSFVLLYGLRTTFVERSFEPVWYLVLVPEGQLS